MTSKLSESLKRLRKARALSQQKLAEAAGVSLIVVTSAEQDPEKDPSMSSLVKLADALGVTIDELIGRTPPQKHLKS